MFDQLQQHEIIWQISAKIKGNKKPFMAFNYIVQNQIFKNKVAFAYKNSKSIEAREVLAKLMPIMSTCAPSNSQSGVFVTKQSDVKI